jgi:hypothetical protein
MTRTDYWLVILFLLLSVVVFFSLHPDFIITLSSRFGEPSSDCSRTAHASRPCPRAARARDDLIRPWPAADRPPTFRSRNPIQCYYYVVNAVYCIARSADRKYLYFSTTGLLCTRVQATTRFSHRNIRVIPVRTNRTSTYPVLIHALVLCMARSWSVWSNMIIAYRNYWIVGLVRFNNF